MFDLSRISLIHWWGRREDAKKKKKESDMNERHVFISYIGSLRFGHRLRVAGHVAGCQPELHVEIIEGSKGFSKPVFKHSLCEHCEWAKINAKTRKEVLEHSDCPACRTVKPKFKAE